MIITRHIMDESIAMTLPGVPRDLAASAAFERLNWLDEIPSRVHMRTHAEGKQTRRILAGTREALIAAGVPAKLFAKRFGLPILAEGCYRLNGLPETAVVKLLRGYFEVTQLFELKGSGAKELGDHDHMIDRLPEGTSKRARNYPARTSAKAVARVLTHPRFKGPPVQQAGAQQSTGPDDPALREMMEIWSLLPLAGKSEVARVALAQLALAEAHAGAGS